MPPARVPLAPPVYPAIEMPFPPVVPGAPPPAPLLGPVPPAAPQLPGAVLIAARAYGQGPEGIYTLPPAILLILLQACSTFEELLNMRLFCRPLFNVYELNSSTLLTLMLSRYLSRDGNIATRACVEHVKEILIYQRYMVQGEIPPAGQRALRELIHNRLVRANRRNLVMRVIDIPQLKENHMFFEGFQSFYREELSQASYTTRHTGGTRWAMLKNESMLDFDIYPMVQHGPGGAQSIRFEVDAQIRMEDFYSAWLITYRFKYERLEDFIRRGPPWQAAHLGKIHFVAFLMDQFYQAGVSFHRKSGTRHGPQNANPMVENIRARRRVLDAWRLSCFMGVWFPLKTEPQGFFSLNFALGMWERLFVRGDQVGFDYRRRTNWGAWVTYRGGGHIIYWKLLSQLAITTYHNAPLLQKRNGTWMNTFVNTKRTLDTDFSTFDTMALARRYGLLDI